MVHFLSLKRLIKAFCHSWNGLCAAARDEAAFQLELAICALLISLAVFLHIGTLERVLLIGSLLLVLIVELLNSAVEAVADRISDEFHPLSRKAKDIASAAVLLTLLLAGFVWGAVLLEPSSL